MEESKRAQGVAVFLLGLLLFTGSVAGTGILSYLFFKDWSLILRNSIMTGAGIGTVLFLMAQAREAGLYEYDNAAYRGRFFLCFFAGLFFSFCCAGLPAGGWPYVAVFVLLALFSNSLIGICGGTTLLMISMLLSGAPLDVFFLYFISGTVAVCVFSRLDENYKVGIPLVISLIILSVNLTAQIVLAEEGKLRPEFFLIPLMNVVITCILLLAILKLFSNLVIFKYRERYMEINDPECPLLVELKNTSREEYYRAVHTAYLSDKIAKKLQLDDKVAKAGGYYHRIGILKGENTWENVQQIAQEYRFPPEVGQVLEEYLKKDSRILNKETAVLYFADAVVNAILYMMEKSSDEKLDYDQIIDTVFQKKQDKPCFRDCKITIGEFYAMKKIFKEEKLYYDFLR